VFAFNKKSKSATDNIRAEQGDSKRENTDFYFVKNGQA
jgi:hypothetical protein